MMSESSEGVTQLVQLCVEQGRSGPWTDLLELTGKTIRDRFVVGGGSRADLPEFVDWFPGWLFEQRKLHTLVCALARRIEDGECTDANSQDAFSRNYFAQIVGTGKAEYYRERRSREKLADTHDLSKEPDDRVTSGKSHEPQMAELSHALASLGPDLRVPFRLRHYKACGPLTADEEQWISERSGVPHEEIEGIVANEFRRNRERAFPLSSEFIGELLAIPPSTTGRNTTVDQRVSRARTRLREILKGSDE